MNPQWETGQKAISVSAASPIQTRLETNRGEIWAIFSDKAALRFIGAGELFRYGTAYGYQNGDVATIPGCSTNTVLSRCEPIRVLSYLRHRWGWRGPRGFRNAL